jgi:hypothetical protein
MTPSVAALLIAALYALHQDLWFWSDARPLVLGFLPIGLFYQVLFTFACSAVFWVLVRYQWPDHLESAADERPSRRA